jgi:hypothetical protein
MIQKFKTPYQTEVYYVSKEKEVITNEAFKKDEYRNKFSFVFENDFNGNIRKLILECNNSNKSFNKSVIVIHENKEIKIYKNVPNNFDIPIE